MQSILITGSYLYDCFFYPSLRSSAFCGGFFLCTRKSRRKTKQCIKNAIVVFFLVLFFSRSGILDAFPPARLIFFFATSLLFAAFNVQRVRVGNWRMATQNLFKTTEPRQKKIKNKTVTNMQETYFMTRANSVNKIQQKMCALLLLVGNFQTVLVCGIEVRIKHVKIKFYFHV